MTKLDLAKRATSFVVGFGASAIVGSIIKNNAAPSNLPEQVAVPVASYVLGAMLANETRKYTDAKIDEMAYWYKTHVKNY